MEFKKAIILQQPRIDNSQSQRELRATEMVRGHQSLLSLRENLGKQLRDDVSSIFGSQKAEEGKGLPLKTSTVVSGLP